MATIQCILLDGREHYCLIKCSSEQFAPYSHSNITSSGLVVFGVLNGLTSGHRYYCRAAAVNAAMTVPNENESMTKYINFSTLSTIKGNTHIGTVDSFHQAHNVLSSTSSTTD